ncbi:MAG: hypothetical protein AAFN65_06975, partial [Bacteroidota bacterium]
TLHFEYKLSVKDVGLFTSMPRWRPQQYDQSVEFAEYNVIYPTNNEIYLETNSLDEPFNTMEDGKHKLVFRLENLPAPDWEWASPARMSNLPYLMAGFVRFEVDGYQGSMKDWESFGTFLRDLNDGRQSLPTELSNEVNQIAEGLDSDEKKITALYRLLQERTRYVSVQLGIGGWQPFDAAYVEENRYGDCKALSNYMRSLLAEVGIESWPVIIQAGDRPYYNINSDFAVNAFNHQILYVPESDMYLECTSSDAPPGYLSDFTCNRQVLLLTPQGGQLGHTPIPQPEDNRSEQNINIEIQSDGTADLDLVGVYHGARQDMLRGINSGMSRDEQLEYLHQRDYLPALQDVEYELTVDPDSPEASLNYSCSLDRYGRRMGTRLFVPLNRHFAYDFIPPADSERNYPIVLRQARSIVDTIQLVLPEDMEVESIGDAITEFSHEAGTYRSEIQQKENLLVWTRELRLQAVELPADAYEELRDFYIQIGRADGRQVVLKEKRAR